MYPHYAPCPKTKPLWNCKAPMCPVRYAQYTLLPHQPPRLLYCFYPGLLLRKKSSGRELYWAGFRRIAHKWHDWSGGGGGGGWRGCKILAWILLKRMYGKLLPNIAPATTKENSFVLSTNKLSVKQTSYKKIMSFKICIFIATSSNI